MTADVVYAIARSMAVPEPAPTRVFSVEGREMGGTVFEIGPTSGDLAFAVDHSTGDRWWIAADEVASGRSGVHPGLSVPLGKRGLAFRRHGHAFFFSREYPEHVFCFHATNPGEPTTQRLDIGFEPVDLVFGITGDALLLGARGELAEVENTEGPVWTAGREWHIDTGIASVTSFGGLASAGDYLCVSGENAEGSFIGEIIFSGDRVTLEPPFDLGAIGYVGNLASPTPPDRLVPS